MGLIIQNQDQGMKFKTLSVTNTVVKQMANVFKVYSFIVYKLFASLGNGSPNISAQWVTLVSFSCLGVPAGVMVPQKVLVAGA